MTTWHVDWSNTAAATISLTTFVIAVVLPLVFGVREGRSFSVLRGMLLSGMGGLYILRTTAAIGTVSLMVATDMPQPLFANLIALLLVLIWGCSWNEALPRIGSRIVDAAHAWAVVPWVAVGLTLLYFLVFVVGALPGYVAQAGHVLEGGRAGLEVRYQRDVEAARQKNALEACSRVSELNTRLQPAEDVVARTLPVETLRRIDLVLKDWALKRDTPVPDCARQLQTRSTPQMKTLISQIDSTFGLAYNKRRLRALSWASEPTVVDAQILTAKALNLGPFFSSALTSPFDHIAKAGSQIDLVTKWLML